MPRRNRVNQGPLVIMMLLILAAWLFWQSGATSLRSPAGLLLLLAVLLVLNAFLRKRATSRTKNKQAEHTPLGHIPRPHRTEYNRRLSSQRAYLRTARTTKPETWPYDGSYCVHCGLKKRGEGNICRRCNQPMDYPS